MRKAKKVIGIMAASAMIAALLAGCGGSTSSSSSTGSSTQQSGSQSSSESVAEGGSVSGTVSMGGSTSVEEVIAALSEAFMAENPDVDLTYEPSGSGAGITGATEGTLDIGLSSRSLKESEIGVSETVFALDGIAVIVNNENGVTDLTLEQIKGLANGTITNWKEVGGADAPVVFVGREAGSGTRDGFESIVGVEDECVYEQEHNSTGAVIAAVSANPNAFGYASLSALEDTVKAVTVGGVECSEATVQDGTYKIQRPFVFITNDSNQPSEAASAFMEFATSETVADLIAEAGAVPPVK